jgi:hypothetical protein
MKMKEIKDSRHDFSPFKKSKSFHEFRETINQLAFEIKDIEEATESKSLNQMFSVPDHIRAQ